MRGENKCLHVVLKKNALRPRKKQGINILVKSQEVLSIGGKKSRGFRGFEKTAIAIVGDIWSLKEILIKKL